MGSGPGEIPLKAMTPHIGAGHQSSSHIPFIRSSLNLQIENLKTLSVEMERFEGVSEGEKNELRQKLLDKYAPHNTHLRVDDFEKFVDEQLSYLTESSRAFVRRYSSPYMSLAVPIVLLSAALAEALVNSLVATGLILYGRSDLFVVFDRMDIREKWRLGPRLIDDSIHADPGDHRFGHLKELIELRNAFMHSKIDIVASDQAAKIKGTSHHQIMIDPKGRGSLIEFASLPDAIFDLVIEAIVDHSTRVHLAGSSFRFTI
jgi:hypothetical protein